MKSGRSAYAGDDMHIPFEGSYLTVLAGYLKSQKSDLMLLTRERFYKPLILFYKRQDEALCGPVETGQLKGVEVHFNDPSRIG
jgi:hypothetical protein